MAKNSSKTINTASQCHTAKSTLRAVLIDDEPLARQRLRHLLAATMLNQQLTCHIECIAEFDRIKTAQTWLQQYSADLVFLDVEMPGGSGMDLARWINIQLPKLAIIFTSAYDHYAVQAFRLDTVDYLSKPLCPKELKQALHRVMHLGSPSTGVHLSNSTTKSNQNHCADTSDNLHGLNQCQHLSARSHQGIELIPLGDIWYCLAEDKYTVVHHQYGTAIIGTSLKQLEHDFSEAMLRIHRSTLVMRHRIVRLDLQPANNLLYLEGLSRGLVVSRRHLTVVKRLLKQGY